MKADPDNPELFPEFNAAGALRAAFESRRRTSGKDAITSTSESAAHPPRALGYEMQGEIARGGMGVIHKAFDRELDRDVALKVLRDELSGETRLVRRFLEEARVTARLDHPGIVPVYEVGRDPQGRPFFAMRLVRGRELRRIIELAHTNAEGWSQTRALTVIQKVCEAMAYAHGRGVIHRDLKPSNVMVGEFGEVYVMDWGLARKIGSEDTHDMRLRPASTSARSKSDKAETAERDSDRSHTDIESPIVTMDGDVLGTPCYMSPEQARGELAELGPRSDVYSLGAMLYHLLAGEMPYVPSGASVASRQVLLHLVQGPPRPLTEVQKDVPSELVAISEKAMSREPKDRYPDMLSMAEDVRAFLERRVVSAYETGAWAEAKKWVQRNKRLSAAMVLAVAALIAGLLVSLSLKAKSDANYVRAENNAVEAESNARTANDERDKALKISSFLEDTLKGAAPSVALGRDTTMLREMMDAAWKRVEKGELSAAPEAELRLMLLIGETNFEIGQREKAGSIFDAALKKARVLFPADHVLLAQCLSGLGHVLSSRGSNAGAEPILREALEMHRRLFPGDHPKVAESLEKFAVVKSDSGQFAEAEALNREALAMRERLFTGDHESIALACNNLGSLLQDRGDLDAAEPFLRRAIEMQERLFKGDHPQLATSLDNLGALSSARGDLAGAETLHRRSLEMRRRLFGAQHPDVAVSINNLAMVLYDRGRFAESEALFREALDMRKTLLQGDDPIMAQALANLASVLQARGDLAGAEPLYREALDMLQRLYSGDNSLIPNVQSSLAVLLKARGDFEQAEAFCREALAMQRRLFPGDHPDICVALNNLASLLNARGDLVGAEPLYREALEMQLRVSPADHPILARMQTNLGGVLQQRGDWDGAEALFRQALEMHKRLNADDHPDVAKASSNLAVMLARRGDLAGSESLLRDALRIYRGKLPPEDARIANAEVDLASVLGREKQFAEADELLRAAVEALASIPNAPRELCRKCLHTAVDNAAAWEESEPGGGHADRAGEWKQKLSEIEHE